MQYTYELFLKELGARLKQMRKDRGWTLRTMVVDHKFHFTHWQGFESGSSISVPSLLKVCGVFDITLEDLVRGLGCSESSKETPSMQDAELEGSSPARRASRSKKPRSEGQKA